MLHRRDFLMASLAVSTTLAGAVASRAAAPVQLTLDDIFIDTTSPALGNQKGNVPIACFFDFQCSYCKHDYPQLLQTIRQDGNIRLILKHWPIFGDTSVYAARLSLAAVHTGQYEAVVETLILATGPLSPARIDSLLNGAGIDAASLKAGYERYQQTIDTALDRNDAHAAAFKFPGTPSYIVGQKSYSGAMSETRLKTAIEKARA
jgi:protein-disulfide isomerase